MVYRSCHHFSRRQFSCQQTAKFFDGKSWTDFKIRIPSVLPLAGAATAAAATARPTMLIARVRHCQRRFAPPFSVVLVLKVPAKQEVKAPRSSWWSAGGGRHQPPRQCCYIAICSFSLGGHLESSFTRGGGDIAPRGCDLELAPGLTKGQSSVNAFLLIWRKQTDRRERFWFFCLFIEIIFHSCYIDFYFIIHMMQKKFVRWFGPSIVIVTGD